MKIKWLVQDVGIHMVNIHANFEALQRLGFKYSNFGLIAHTQNITNLENVLEDPEEHFIIRGGTKMLSILEGATSLSPFNELLTPEQIKHEAQYIERLREGIFYNEEKFDQAYYSHLDIPLLNKGAEFYAVKDNLTKTFNKPMFIKPSKDQKAFDAGIIEPNTTIEHFITQGKHQKTYIEEQVVIAPCKIITAEYRFFVVAKEVITGSRYRLASKGNLSDNIPPEVMKAAREYAKLYQPHDVFTMDLAETPEGIVIIEYNCWNASGSYHCDLMKTFHAVQEYKSSQMLKDKPQIKW